MHIPRPPSVASTSDASSATFTDARDRRDTDYNVLPESTDTSNFNQFYHFLRDWEGWQMNNDKACRKLTSLMESTIQIQYRDLTEPKQLLDTIKTDSEKVIKVDSRWEMVQLT
jgi:hypothetical protein